MVVLKNLLFRVICYFTQCNFLSKTLCPKRKFVNLLKPLCDFSRNAKQGHNVDRQYE